jgi:hypothetical protein
MSKNLLALLIAGALIVLSAIEITYMSVKSEDPIKQVALPLDESKTKSVRSRATVSVHGVPIQIPLGSSPVRSVRAQSAMGEE